MKSIDFKSLLIGILGTALVMVLMGQSNLKEQYDIECIGIKESVTETDQYVCKRFRLNGEGWNDLNGTAVFDTAGLIQNVSY